MIPRIVLKRHLPTVASATAGLGYLIYSQNRPTLQADDPTPPLPIVQEVPSSTTLLSSEIVTTITSTPPPRRTFDFQLQDTSKMNEEEKKQYYDDLFWGILSFDYYDEEEHVKDLLQQKDGNEALLKKIEDTKKKIKEVNQRIYEIKDKLNVPE